MWNIIAYLPIVLEETFDYPRVCDTIYQTSLLNLEDTFVYPIERFGLKVTPVSAAYRYHVLLEVVHVHNDQPV